jgi:hypothetical protein
MTTPLPQVTAATNIASSREFLPRIALFVGEAGSYLSVGIFDTQTEELEIVDQPTETRFFGRPLWSPGRDLLAYAQSEEDTSSIRIYDPAGANTRLLMAATPQADEGNESEPSIFLFGWSDDAEWLAYEYIYESVPGDLHLVNRSTSENIPISETGQVYWFEWSPHSTAFAISDSEAIYVGSPSSPNELEIFQGKYELGLIAWHPKDNKLLVTRTDNRANDGFNELWSLNLDHGDWVRVGSFPEISYFTYSPDGQLITVFSSAHWLDINLLTVVDTRTFEVVVEVELPEDILFSKLDWLDDEVMLTSSNNIYIVPIDSVDQSYWYFEPGDSSLESLPRLTFTDW